MKSFLKAILRETNNPVLHNKFVLYAIFIIALVYLYTLSVQRSWFHIVVFMLIGYITTFFSKNMLIILLLSTVFTFVLKNGTNISHEGFEDNQETGAEPETETETEIPPTSGSGVYLKPEEDKEEAEETEETETNQEEEKKETETFTGYSKKGQLDKIISMLS